MTVKLFASQVSQYLNEGGFTSAKNLSTYPQQRKYVSGSGGVHYRTRMMESRGAFEAKQNGDDVLVRHFGTIESESDSLADWARVLLNCSLEVEVVDDPKRDGRLALHVTKGF